MNGEPPGYISYLLRLSYAGSDDGPSWRAALDNPRSGERQVFGNLEELFAFLEEKTLGSAPHLDQPYPARLPGQEEMRGRD
jgi:hypothetical protein